MGADGSPMGGLEVQNYGEMTRKSLEAAARARGIELQYTDTWGQTHVASDQTLIAILEALGPSEEAGLAPTLVVYQDDATVWLPVGTQEAGGTLKLEFEWEGGELQHHWYFAPELPQEGDGKRFPLPALRLGYHRLRLHHVVEPQLTTLQDVRFIVCPRRAMTLDTRVAGVALALYGLKSDRNWGVGDTADLKEVVTGLAAAGTHFVALNPLHALPNRQPYNISPYLPECSLYRNYIYLDVERVPGYSSTDADWAEIVALRATEFVEYEAVAALKRKALRAAFDRFLDHGATEELHAYAEAEGELLDDYATYCALWFYLHEKDPKVWLWTDWPKGYQDPRSISVRNFQKKNATEILFFKFLQWQLDRQFCEVQDHARACGMKIGLYHDLALATDRYGADLWANRRFFAVATEDRPGARVGAPPDELAPSGQDWGFPPPNRDAHRANGYELFAQSIRKNARHGGALRIDHVMRFLRLFWIPDALTAKDGAYVRDHAEDLLRVLCLESARNGFIVIGEDLGTVPPGTRERLTEGGIMGYRVLWFEKDWNSGRMHLPHEYSEFAAVSTTTHDLPTLAGFFTGRDIEARKAAGLVDEAGYQQQWEARHRDIEQAERAFAEAGFPHDVLGFVLATPTKVAIINQEDLTGETEQQNLPASTWEHPNWRRKMKVSVAEFNQLTADLRTKIEHSGRL